MLYAEPRQRPDVSRVCGASPRYDGRLYVAVGDNGKILSSPDSVTWTSRSVPEFAGNIYFNGIIWDGTRYLAGGQDYDFGLAGWVAVVYSSTNGINWTRNYKSGSALGPVNALASCLRRPGCRALDPQ